MPDEPHPDTLCARPQEIPGSVTKPLVSPLQLSVVYRIDNLDQVDALYQHEAEGFVYARDGHPNAAQLAAKVAAIEGADAALVCGSGMAAVSAALLSRLDGGGHIALSDGLYGKTVTLVAKELSRFGVRHTLFDATKVETLRAALTPETRVVFAETLSNPLLRMADLAALASVAHDAGAILVIDHTFAPLLCQPIALGADLVVHSATKLIGGHSDLTLGLLAGPSTLINRASALASTFGLTGNPFESWLALRGLTTLAVRSTRACASALDLAHRLERHPKVLAAHYPGLASHPDHRRACLVFQGGFGTIATIDLGGRSQADGFIRALKHIPYAPSLGDVATTLSHPATTSHRGQDPDQWSRQGITPGLIRLSIGLEAPDDLWGDLNQALGAI
ncbi:MAG: PLP-dependent aspartate aminotransferase family protein [Isosphaeraceae bacterium]